MKHAAIRVCVIHPNPHRDFTRNPIREDQVEKIIESIGRTGFWDNVVVREHPERPGEYQLAYGHSRLEAVKQAGITEVVLPVAPMSDWDMYCAMVDENETQQQITPAIAFENVETGVAMLEKAFKAVGQEGSYEAFNETLGRAVPRGTARHSNDHGFEQARNAFFRGEGIGRGFVTVVLPSGKVHGNVINEVLNTHYGQQREAAKRKEAEAKQRAADSSRKEAEAKRKQAESEAKEAEAKRKEAEAEKDQAEAKRKQADAEKDQAEAIRKRAEADKARVEAKRKEEEARKDQAEAEKHKAEAKRLQEESDKATREAEALKAEAKRIGERSIDAGILLNFDTPRQMTAFAAAVKASGIPKSHHHAAMEHAIENDFSVRQMSEKLDLWWYVASGQQGRDDKRHARDAALDRFAKQYRNGDYTQFLMAIGKKVRDLTSDIKIALPAARYYDHAKHRANLIRDIDALVEQLRAMSTSLVVGNTTDAIDVEWRLPETKALGIAVTNGATGDHVDD